MAEETKQHSFKNPNFKYNQPGARVQWKNLKQIIAAEKAEIWPENAATYSSINAPPSLLPAKKYSDISGLIAPYTDPQTKLRFHNAEEYAILQVLPSDITAGYLALRGASTIVG